MLTRKISTLGVLIWGGVEKETEKVDKIIRSITNRFSICLFSHCNFLFLGDLETQEINTVIDYLKTHFCFNHVPILIPPHHGTHWGKIMNDIYAHVLVASNGKMRNRYFDERYKNISGNCFSTFLNGTIVIGTNPDPDIILLDALPMYKKIFGMIYHI
jgi:beta-lactamase superfamily II metal-dependent hydrolase